MIAGAGAAAERGDDLGPARASTGPRHDPAVTDVLVDGSVAPAQPDPVQALIVVDAQVGFLTGAGAVPAADRVVGQIGQLLAAARAAASLVVQLRNDGEVGALDEPDTPTWQLQHLPRPDEQVVAKSGDDGFDDTELGLILARAAVARLAVCGVLSEMCVAATVRAALDRGYEIVLATSAHATYDVPPGPGGSPGVPAALAARAAEWALGDEVEIVADAAAVPFAPAP